MSALRGHFPAAAKILWRMRKGYGVMKRIWPRMHTDGHGCFRRSVFIRVYPWLICFRLFAAVDGTVINRTTGQPAPGTILQLVQPGQAGMQTLASAKTDAEGKFQFDKDPQGPVLIQAIFSGVLYTKVVMPGAPRNGVEVDVFQLRTNLAPQK